MTVAHVACKVAGCKWSVASDRDDAARRLFDHMRLTHPRPPAMKCHSEGTYAGTGLACHQPSGCCYGAPLSVSGRLQMELDNARAAAPPPLDLLLDWKFESGAIATLRAPAGAKVSAAELAAFVKALRGLVGPGQEGTS